MGTHRDRLRVEAGQDDEEWKLVKMTSTPRQIFTMDLLLELVRRMHQGSEGGPGGGEDK